MLIWNVQVYFPPENSRWNEGLNNLKWHIYSTPSFFLSDSGISIGGGRGMASATLTPS